MTQKTSQSAPKLPSHPEPHSMKWSRLELETIADYGVRCFEAARAELASQQEVAAHVGDADGFGLRGALASELLCWHRLTTAEAENLLAFIRNQKPADAFAHMRATPEDLAIYRAIAASRVPVASPAEPVAVEAGMVLVPLTFLQGFNTLAHNYSLNAIPPDYLRGTEGDAFKMAYRRCGQDLAELRASLATPTSGAGGAGVMDARPDSVHSDSGECGGVQGPEPTDAVRDVLAERARQVEAWGNDHDDEHGYDLLANGAADFLVPGQCPMKACWSFKSKVTDRDPRRVQMVKGAALAISAIEAYDRAEKASTS